MTVAPDPLSGWGIAQMDEVEQAIHQVVDTTVLPVFGQLCPGDITEKSPGELVTVADRRAEAALRDKLTRLLPGSTVVGEEGVGQDPDHLSRLAGPDPVWIIDPIDGTENFIAGQPQFSTLVALAHRNALVASWLHAPLIGASAMAWAGNGATVNGAAIYVGTRHPRPPQLTVSLSKPRWWTADTATWAGGLHQAGAQVSSFDTAGLAYLDLVTDPRHGSHALVLQWQHVWDHAAGVLLLIEAGGDVCGADGRPFRLDGQNSLPMVAAVSAATAHLVHHLLQPAPEVGAPHVSRTPPGNPPLHHTEGPWP